MLVGFPASGIGRAAKCGKEEILGILTALRIFLEQDHEETYRNWLANCREIATGLEGITGTMVSLFECNSKGIPEVHLKVDPRRLGGHSG